VHQSHRELTAVVAHQIRDEIKASVSFGNEAQDGAFALAMTLYETVIIGGGPAGLSAALVLGRCMRRVLVCDSGRYRNERSQALHCYMGHDGIHPSDLLEKARQQLKAYETVFMERCTVSSLTQEQDGFLVMFEERAPARARSLLLATGVVDEVPQIEGIEELYGRSIHVCPYCDGWEHRNSAVAVYGRAEKGTNLALLLRQWTKDLVLCTHGATLSDDHRQALAGRGIVVEEAPIAKLEGVEGCLRRIHFKGGRTLPRQALFFNTDQHPRSPLLERLGCRFDENGGVACDEGGQTSVKGVFVAGDVSRDVQLAIIAAAEGARAGLAINKALLKADGHL
jgi:thioredoxin reductase